MKKTKNKTFLILLFGRTHVRPFFLLMMKQYPEVFLQLKNLENIPTYSLPDGFYFRNYHFKDEENWFSIYQASDGHNKVYSSTFREYFGANTDLLAERQFYLCTESGRPIATATAWYNDDFIGSQWGRVHWLAVHPDYQGMGLSKPLLSKVLNKLKRCHYDKVYLRTYTMRRKAIPLYLSFGFEPLLKNDQDLINWRELALELENPTLDALLK